MMSYGPPQYPTIIYLHLQMSAFNTKNTFQPESTVATLEASQQIFLPMQSTDPKVHRKQQKPNNTPTKQRQDQVLTPKITVIPNPAA